MTPSFDATVAGLRAWAAGNRNDEAAVELLAITFALGEKEGRWAA